MRDSVQPIPSAWVNWLRNRRAALRELVSAALGPTDDGETFGAAPSPESPAALAPAIPQHWHTVASYRTYCGGGEMPWFGLP